MLNNNISGLLKLSEIIKHIKGGKSTRVFSRELGVSHATLNRILEGKHFPEISTFYKISQHCSYTAVELIAIACGVSENIAPVKTAEEAIELVRDLNVHERVKLIQVILEEMPKEERKQAFLKLIDALID